MITLDDKYRQILLADLGNKYFVRWGERGLARYLDTLDEMDIIELELRVSHENQW